MMTSAEKATASAKWLRTADLLFKKQISAACAQLNISDTAVNRQLVEERALLEQDRIHFERQLFEDVSRVKRLVINVDDLVSKTGGRVFLTEQALVYIVQCRIGGIGRGVYSVQGAECR